MAPHSILVTKANTGEPLPAKKEREDKEVAIVAACES